MSRRTLLDRDLDISWLDTALQVAADRTSTVPPRQRLDFSLRDAQLAEDARRKTVNALARSWFDVDPAARDLVLWAVEHASEVVDTRAIHAGVLLATQPFFADVCSVVGRALALEGEIATPTLRQRMKEQWGQRRSVDVATQRAVKTLRSLQLVTGEPGSSVSRKGRQITVDGSWIPWLVHALLLARGAEAMAESDLRAAPELFTVAWPTAFPNGYPHLERHTEGGGRVVYAIRRTVR